MAENITENYKAIQTDNYSLLFWKKFPFGSFNWNWDENNWRNQKELIFLKLFLINGSFVSFNEDSFVVEVKKGKAISSERYCGIKAPFQKRFCFQILSLPKIRKFSFLKNSQFKTAMKSDLFILTLKIKEESTSLSSL